MTHAIRRLGIGGGFLLCAVGSGPCADPAGTATSPASATPAALAPPATPASGSSSAAPPFASASVSPATTAEERAASKPPARITRSHMRGHFLETVRMREAIVRGRLPELQAAAGSLASDIQPLALRGDYRPYLDSVRTAARSVAAAESVVAGAAALGKLGEVCASCHLKFGGPDSPLAPVPLANEDGADPNMVAHALATDRLWEGLILPSDTSWLGGTRVLMDAVRLDGDVPELVAAGRHLRELARNGASAAASQRGASFANILLTCASCHARFRVETLMPEPR